MNFCESCNACFPDERCPRCGRKRLRPVTDEDFCLTARVSRIFGDNLKCRLEEEGIACVSVPYGSGIHTRFALPMEDYLIYVRYKDREYVRQLIAKTRG